MCLPIIPQGQSEILEKSATIRPKAAQHAAERWLTSPGGNSHRSGIVSPSGLAVPYLLSSASNKARTFVANYRMPDWPNMRENSACGGSAAAATEGVRLGGQVRGSRRNELGRSFLNTPDVNSSRCVPLTCPGVLAKMRFQS